MRFHRIALKMGFFDSLTAPERIAPGPVFYSYLTGLSMGRARTLYMNSLISSHSS